jgi:predicted phage terminase large subunit-like protein
MLMSPAFQKFSNYLPLRQDSQKAEEWKTEPVKGMIGGSYRAATLAGALTGFGFGVSGIDTWGGCCTIDDPTKASMNISRADIKACIDLYTGSLKSRANNPKAPFIMIMQRLDPDDLTGYVLENETDEWEQLKIPAYDEQTGESIWEDKMPSYKLEAMKKNSVSVYYGQYQQEPIVVGGEVFKSEWFQFYNPNEYYPYQAIYGVADTAMKKGEANDFTVLSLWGQTYTGTIHLLDMVRGKWDAVELVEVFKATWEKWQHRDIQPYGIYIEDKSSGIGLIQTLKTQTSIPFLPIQRTSYKTDDGILVRADKYSRALAVVPHIAAGRVLLPNNPTDEVSAMLLTEATAFRSDLRAKHDDCVDCLCDAVNIAFSPNFISSVYI